MDGRPPRGTRRGPAAGVARIVELPEPDRGRPGGRIARDLAFGREFLVRRADRLLFGTDYLKPGQEVPQFEVLAKFDLPPVVRTKIERENAIRLLGLKDLRSP